MALSLSYRIKIGRAVLSTDLISNVVIETSRNNLTSTARIKIAGDLGYHFGILGFRVSELMKEGDKVEIYLGYDGKNTLEFSGYVSLKIFETPFEIVCYDDIWLLKQKPVNKHWVDVKLSVLLKELIPEGIINVPEITIHSLRISNSNAYDALEKIKGLYGLDIYYRYGKVFAGLAYTDIILSKSNTVKTPSVLNQANRIKLDTTKNVIKDNIVQLPNEIGKIRIKAVSMYPDNTSKTVYFGEKDGQLRSLHFYKLSESELKQQAEIAYKKISQRGKRGTITLFGLPFVKHGDIVDFNDPYRPQKNTISFVEAVKIEFGTSGFRRILSLGPTAKVNGSKIDIL